MSKLTFTESAQADLLQAWLYVADENLAAADGVLEAIEHDAGSASSTLDGSRQT